MTGLLVCLLLVVAIVVAIVTLLMRNIALLLLVVSLPLTLAGSAGPAITRSWLNAAIRLFVALLLAKPLIVIAVRLGRHPGRRCRRAGEPQATFTDALLGVAIILLAGLLPGVIYRFSGGLMTTQAGTAPRASGGFSEQSGHAATSAADSAWALAQLNPMPPLTRETRHRRVQARALALPGPGCGRCRPRPAPSGRPWRPRQWSVVRWSRVVGGWPGRPPPPAVSSAMWRHPGSRRHRSPATAATAPLRQARRRTPPRHRRRRISPDVPAATPDR